MKRILLPAAWVFFFVCAIVEAQDPRRLLYVAEPGIRNDLQYGGQGVIVFDIDHDYRFLKRISLGNMNDDKGKALNVKGICASSATKRLYVSTIADMTCVDLVTEKILWKKTYEAGCDRMAISPDGKAIYLPSFEKDHWKVIDMDGAIIGKITPNSGAHNTVYGIDGSHAYLAGLKSPILTVADTSTHAACKTIGPFSNFIRPFTVNGKQTLCFCCVNDLLGFEIGDLASGEMIYRIQVQGFEKGKVARHGCPSHGIGMTPDEKEIWVTDAHNHRMHIFDATVMPPKQLESIELRDEPGWITFSIDGSLAWPSTGDVIDVKNRKIIGGLKDEEGRAVQSEKLLEIDFAGDEPVRAGCQFGVGQLR